MSELLEKVEALETRLTKLEHYNSQSIETIKNLVSRLEKNEEGI